MFSKYSCLFFGEGRKDKKFLIALVELDKFKYHTQKWSVQYDSSCGSSPRDILMRCKNTTRDTDFDLILCFIDLDQMKHNYPNKWENEKKKLEVEYSEFTIIWQIDNAEEEYKKVLGDQYDKKWVLNKEARKNVEKFINSDFWKRILCPIKQRESVLDKLIKKP